MDKPSRRNCSGIQSRSIHRNNYRTAAPLTVQKNACLKAMKNNNKRRRTCHLSLHSVKCIVDSLPNQVPVKPAHT
jgi:hypothetical protein